LSLPALDLPISRTGLALYYPSVFRVAPEPGSFRGQAYVEPSSPVLKAEGVHAVTEDVSESWRPDSAAQAALQSLASNYRAHAEGRKTAAPLPAGVAFPVVGPSLFLVSELTGENQSPGIDLTYQREKNGGVK
jgi:hypothetical protein